MLFLDGAYVGGPEGAARFRWVKAPTSAEFAQLVHTLAHRVRRYLERQGLPERDAENRYLASDAVNEDPMNQLLGHSNTYRIAVGRRRGARYLPYTQCLETVLNLPLPGIMRMSCFGRTFPYPPTPG